ncbi:MAG: stage II sporulation protein R [Bacilli bacterium]|nr:stage II sporulation protein R [Bacilli bacterium]
MKRKIFLLVLGLILIAIYSVSETELSIPDSSIRLRVIPNSNNSMDINIKEQVKDYLETDVYTLLKETNDIDSARNIINNNIPKIETNIDNIFKDNNYNIPYEVNFGYNYFPEKTFAGENYQEGYYESLVIYIGDAKGDNWWCVLFPNFCLVDTEKDTEYKSYFKELFNKIF